MASAYPSKLVPACSMAKSSLSDFLSEATSKIKCVFSYGYLPRPPENCFFSCSWCIYSDLICKFVLTLPTIDTNSGMVFVVSGSNNHGDNISAFWPRIERRYAHRKGELQLEHYRQNHTCGVDVQHLVLTALSMISVINLPAVAERAFQSSFPVATHMQNVEKIGHFPAVVEFAMYLFINVLQAHAKYSAKPASKLLQFSYDDTALRKFTLMLLKCGLLWCKNGCTLMELSQDTGDLISHTSRYHQFVVRFIALKATRSSTGFAVNQLTHYMFDPLVTHLFAASSILDSLKTDSIFVSAYWLSMKQDVVCGRPEEAGYISLWEWFSYFLLCLHIQLVDSVVLFSGSKAASTHHALQWQQSFPSLSLQGMSRAFAFTNLMLVAGSVWFRSILDLLYCSLPRPPEAPCDLGCTSDFHIPRFTWFSSPRCKFLTS